MRPPSCLADTARSPAQWASSCSDTPTRCDVAGRRLPSAVLLPFNNPGLQSRRATSVRAKWAEAKVVVARAHVPGAGGTGCEPEAVQTVQRQPARFLAA